MRIGITERGDAAIHFDEAVASASRVDAAILISKNPSALKHKLAKHNFPVPYIVHATITGFGKTRLEPGVPKWQDAIQAVEAGDVLRIDPIIPTARGVSTALRVLQACPQATRIRISFLDMYPHVKKRFVDNSVTVPYNTLHAELSIRQQALELLQSATPVQIEVCGEPGLSCTGCISQLDLDHFGLGQGSGNKGQRQSCGCLAEKTELLSHRGQCPHGCLYCYWK